MLGDAIVLVDHIRGMSPSSGRNMQISLLPVFALELIKFMEWLDDRKESLFRAELIGRWDVICLITSLKNEFH